MSRLVEPKGPEYKTPRWMYWLVCAATVIAIILMLSSCARNGYGCHGRGKIITRVK